MTFFGKIIGAILGFVVLGPIGAILGFIVGSIFDRGLKLHLYHFPRQHTAEVQQAFFTATFSVMGHLAKADGQVSVYEIKAAENIMSRLELNEELRIEAIRLFNEGKKPDFDLKGTLEVLYRDCSHNRDLLRFFIEIQLEAALADGELQPTEQKLLLYICESLHFSSLEFQQLWSRQWASQAFHQWYSQFEGDNFGQREGSWQQEETQWGGTSWSSQSRTRSRGGYQRGYQQGYTGQRSRSAESSLQDAYGVLGVVATAVPAEIKKAYRRLMNQHHPDKLASRGLPEHMMKLAKEKTQQIRAAYDLIREARGFR